MGKASRRKKDGMFAGLKKQIRANQSSLEAELDRFIALVQSGKMFFNMDSLVVSREGKFARDPERELAIFIYPGKNGKVRMTFPARYIDEAKDEAIKRKFGKDYDGTTAEEPGVVGNGN